MSYAPSRVLAGLAWGTHAKCIGAGLYKGQVRYSYYSLSIFPPTSMADSKHPDLDTSTDATVTPTSKASPSVENMAQDNPSGKVADILFGNDRQVLLIPGSEDPPPEFTPYEAEYELTNDGDIVSHDPHLNEDGTCHNDLYMHRHRPSPLLKEKPYIASCCPRRNSRQHTFSA